MVSNVPPTIDQALAAGERNGAEVRVVQASGDLRLEALREDALTYGVRSGLARRAYEIRQLLQRDAPELDRIFDFNALLMDKNVLPPVLTEAQQLVQSEGTDVIRITDRTYAIVQQARFVTVAPTWRNYLIGSINYSYTPPEADLRPRTPAEQSIWATAVRTGWSSGALQADQIFDQSLARLKRDFGGMVLYRTLLSRGMVSKPFVAEARYGITGDGNHVNINERMLRITALPQMQPFRGWKPIAVPAVPMAPSPTPGGQP